MLGKGWVPERERSPRGSCACAGSEHARGRPEALFLGMFPACPESCRWLEMEAGVRAAVLTRLLLSRGRISLAGFSRGSLARGIFNKLSSSSWQRTAVFKVAYRERRSRALILIFWEHPLVQLTYFSSVYF